MRGKIGFGSRGEFRGACVAREIGEECGFGQELDALRGRRLGFGEGRKCRRERRTRSARPKEGSCHKKARESVGPVAIATVPCRGRERARTSRGLLTRAKLPVVGVDLGQSQLDAGQFGGQLEPACQLAALFSEIFRGGEIAPQKREAGVPNERVGHQYDVIARFERP